jgi:phosphoglycerol transferase MdoB-like AlkP superfamily enzyme
LARPVKRVFSLILPWRTVACLMVLQAALCVLSNQFAVASRLPLFNLDVFLALFGGALGAVLSGISVIVGLVVIVSEVFGYNHIVFSIPELLINLPYFPLKVQVAVYVAGFVALSLLIALPLYSRWERRRRPASARSSRIALAVIFGAFLLGHVGEFLTQWNFAGSTYLTARWELGFLERELLNTDFTHAFVPLPLLAGDAALEAAGRRREDVVVVVVESLGEFADTSLQSQIDAAFQQSAVAQYYSVEKGLRPFSGSTIHGEFRELCGVELRSLFFKTAPSGCLPARFVALGYRTQAYHGNNASFYRRSTWYPEIGLQEIIDLSRLENPKVNHCGGIWDAYCDLDLLAQAGKRVADAKPQFTYVLTLNGHLPARPMTRGVANLTGCRERYPDNVCIHLDNTQRVLNGIAALAVSRAPATILIVGDHAPPFLLESDKTLFLPNSVPYYLLQPKSRS